MIRSRPQASIVIARKWACFHCKGKRFNIVAEIKKFLSLSESI